MLHRSQGEINALELGINFTATSTKPKVLFLLGCDNGISASDIPKDCFVVYIVSVSRSRDPTVTRARNMQT